MRSVELDERVLDLLGGAHAGCFARRSAEEFFVMLGDLRDRPALRIDLRGYRRAQLIAWL